MVTDGYLFQYHFSNFLPALTCEIYGKIAWSLSFLSRWDQFLKHKSSGGSYPYLLEKLPCWNPTCTQSEHFSFPSNVYILFQYPWFMPLSSFWKSFTTFFYLISVCVCVHMKTGATEHCAQRTVCGSLFSSTVCAPWMDLKSWAHLPSEPSHWPNFPSFATPCILYFLTAMCISV